MDLILAEEFLLIALDDEKGTIKLVGKDAKPGLAGALLLDLAAAGAVRVEDDKIQADPSARVEHPMLREAHAVIAGSDKQRKVKGWVDRLPRELKPIDDRLADGLVERGILRREEGKVLGLFSSTKFPEADGSAEADVRGRVTAVLRSERQPTPREATLIALLRSYDVIAKLVAKEDRKAAKARAKEVADQGIAGKAVDDTLKATQAAVIAATATAATVAASGS
jgi:Golgi phosphoprotein 3 (GPP34)